MRDSLPIIEPTQFNFYHDFKKYSPVHQFNKIPLTDKETEYMGYLSKIERDPEFDFINSFRLPYKGDSVTQNLFEVVNKLFKKLDTNKGIYSDDGALLIPHIDSIACYTIPNKDLSVADEPIKYGEPQPIPAHIRDRRQNIDNLLISSSKFGNLRFGALYETDKIPEHLQDIKHKEGYLKLFKIEISPPKNGIPKMERQATINGFELKHYIDGEYKYNTILEGILDKVYYVPRLPNKKAYHSKHLTD